MNKWSSMPLEAVVRWLMGGRYHSLPVWAMAEVLVILQTLVWLEGIGWRETVVSYGVVTVVAMAALNLDIFLAFSTWDRLRNSTDRLLVLIPDLDAAAGDQLIEDTVFNRRSATIIICVCIVLGHLTFLVLGLKFEYLGTKIFVHAGLATLFCSLGYVIATAYGLWRFFYRFSNFELKVSVFHPDGVGGTKFLGDIALRYFVLGSVLVVLWSWGALYSPYQYTDLRMYTIGWVILATSLLIYSLFGPMLNIHRALKLAREKHVSRVTGLYEMYYEKFFPKLETQSIDLDAAMAVFSVISVLDAKIQDMHSWPYHNLSRTIMSVTSFELLTVVAGIWATDKNPIYYMAQWALPT